MLVENETHRLVMVFRCDNSSIDTNVGPSVHTRDLRNQVLSFEMETEKD